MAPEIIMVLALLTVVTFLLITEWFPLEALAMLVMGSLAIAGLVSPKEALAGFSSPAVVTIWAVFILSGGLTRTGIANILGRQLLKVAGGGQWTQLVLIMIIAGGLSAFMNNVAVAALMLPVVMDIARKTDRSPAALLMPLAFGSLLGGLTTMIGTPPNILVSEALLDNGLKPFGFFDYTPVGLCVMAGGIAFISLIGRRLLPQRDIAETTGPLQHLPDQYRLLEHLFQIRIPKGSALAGKTLAHSRLGAALGLNVIGITRGNRTLLAPSTIERIQDEDQLIVEGHPDRIQEMNHWGQLLTETEAIGPEALLAHGMQVARVGLKPDSPHAGQTLADIGFRNVLGLHILTIERNGRTLHTDLKDQPLAAGDALWLYGPSEKVAQLAESPHFQPPVVLQVENKHDVSRWTRDLHQLRVPESSKLVGMSMQESRLGDAADIQILCILRKDGSARIPSADDCFEANDRIIVWGQADMVSMLLMRGLEGVLMRVPGQLTDLRMLEDDQVGMVEVMLSPHSLLSGMSLRKLNFREKYGLTVLAIWRKGAAHQENLRDMALQFGDALLLHGPWNKLHLLGNEPDFLVLTERAQQVPREEKAKVALGIMAAVLFPVIMGWLPIYIAVVLGAAGMIITRCLTMEEAYRYIEWKAVFLIAGMLPLGTALEKTGTAQLIAEGVVGALGPYGPHAVLFGLLAITFMATCIIPTSALVVLMVPIALKTAEGLQISPHALMMGIAMAASASFTSPVSHPANILVMGPGGYKFIDYVKVGLPLTLFVLLILMVVLPIFWPL